MLHQTVFIEVEYDPAVLGLFPQWYAWAAGGGQGVIAHGYTQDRAIKRAKKRWLKAYRKHNKDTGILRSDVTWEIRGNEYEKEF